MKKNELLIEHIDQLHTTSMGVDRIKRNLKLDTDDAVGYCKDLILNPQCRIARQGKNWYCEIRNIRITVNAYSYTIITAHRAVAALPCGLHGEGFENRRLDRHKAIRHPRCRHGYFRFPGNGVFIEVSGIRGRPSFDASGQAGTDHLRRLDGS